MWYRRIHDTKVCERNATRREDAMNQTQRRDEIDLFVDDLLANPARAEELKSKLRRTFGDAPSSPEQRRAQLRLLTLCGDADGEWNNVPI